MDRRVDGLRILACFMVVLLHVSGTGFHQFGPQWWPANIWDSLSRACVPIFFMISGAMLLRKSEPLKDFFWKRASKIVLPLVLWSCFYLWWLNFNGVVTGNWVLAILKGPTMYHLWYFYAVAGLYLFVPILRRFYQASSSAERVFFIVVWFLVSSLYPTVQSLVIDTACGYLRLGVLGDIYHLQYFGGYVGYMLLGAYIFERKWRVSHGLIMFAMGSVGTAIATYMLSKSLGAPCEFFYIYLTPFVVLASIGLFVTFMALRVGGSSAPVSWISGCTLGIYGLHPFVLDVVFMRYGLLNVTGLHWVDPVIAALGIFGLCLAIISCVRLIKPLRQAV